MRIQHNIPAMSAYRNYTANVSGLQKNLEKLSSGYKINRAGDDAAGLAISEKMRAQISGLEQAQSNAKSGINLVQTAEGALTEVHDMLNRMFTLAEQSANGTYDNEVDRLQLQKEVDQLRSEINRIADSSNFNGINLLDGSLDSTQVSTPASSTVEQLKHVNIPILQEAATDPTAEVGSKTVLHVDGATQAVATQFSVDLHNVKITGAEGDTVKFTIGDKTLELDVKATASTTNGELGTTATSGQTLAETIKGAFDNSDKLIGGQEFSVSVSGDKLVFTQATAPNNSKEVVDPDMGVNFELVKADDRAITYTQTLTAEQAALGKLSGVLNIGGYTQAFDSATAISASVGEYNVTYDKDARKLTIVDTNGGEAPKVKFDANTTGTAVTEATSTAGAAGSKAQFTIAAASYTGDFTLGGVTVDYDSASDVTGSVTIGGQAFGFTYSWDSTNKEGTITLEAVNADSAGNVATSDISAAISKAAADTSVAITVTSAVSGADGTFSNNTYNLASATVGAINIGGVTYSDLNALKKAVGANGTVAGGYKLTMSGDTLTVTSNTASADPVDITVTTGIVDKLDIELTQKADTTGIEGTWNKGTTENVKGKPQGGGDLASTTFQLTSDIVSDGSVLTIGENKYTFRVGKDSVVEDGAEGLIDLKDLEAGDANLLKEAASRLTKYCLDNANSAFTVGDDKTKDGVVIIHEKATQTAYKDGELESVEEFDKLVYYDGIKTTTTEASGIDGKALTLQIGDTADEFNQLKVDIKDMHAAAMGIGDIDIGTQEGAADAMSKIKDAINYVSDVRGTLGATQNRLDHTINNLSVMQENIQDAESTIRDVDVAKEMMEYTKNNILVQSAQAMLAQANQLPQGVLQLLG